MGVSAEKQKLAWVSISLGLDHLPEGLILVFSPVYPQGHSMRIRMIDSRFLRFATEVTHWAAIQDPED